MKLTRTGFIVLASCLGLGTGCNKKVTPNVKTDKLVTIQAGGTLGCEVDFPVAVISASKNYPRWASADNEYWIHFVGGSPFGTDPIHVPQHHKSQQLDVTGPPNYYKYEIWNQFDSVSNTHTKCKDADDDRDTGLNIKP
jgi:hypothetical protein